MNLEPSYEEIDVNVSEEKAGLKLVGSPDGQNHSITIHQDAFLYFGRLPQGESIEHQTKNERGNWIHVIEGNLKIADQSLKDGDAISVENVESIVIEPLMETNFLLFDLK